MIALRKETPLMPAGLSHEFLAFVSDQATAEIVSRVCESQGLSVDGIIPGSLDDAIEGLSSITTPPLLVVDLGHAQDIMASAARLAEVCDAGARVILLGEINDLRVYRDVLAAGVADYLVKPFQDADLARSFERARPAANIDMPVMAQPVPETKADCVCVIGVRGGVGASTIAANAAWFVAGELQKSVTLIDMDLTFGTQALILDVDPGNGLSDAMGEPGRMDELFVKRASVTLHERFRVLASETDPSKGDLANAAAFNGLLDYVRDDADLVIVDLPRNLAVAQPEILQSFTRAVLVAEPGLAAMRDSVRLATLIRAVNPNADISVILSRQGIAPKEELSQKTFEDGAGLKIAAIIPFDARTAMRAEAGGKCVLQTARRSKLGKALAIVAGKIAGSDPSASAKPLFGFLKRTFKTQAGGKGV
jgi:pilus assembly protein CpaE